MIEHADIDVGDGLAIHAASRGRGEPLVLVHGFTGSISTWDHVCSRLESRYHIVAIDLPGHGRSSSPSDPARYSLDRFAHDLAAVLDSLRLERVTLLGYSMGGRAALRFAVEHAERLAALILEGTSPGIADDERRAERAASDNALAELIEKSGIESFVSRWEQMPIWKSQAALPAGARRSLREQRLANDPQGLANSLRGAGAGVDSGVLDRLDKVTTPTLLIAGELDSAYVALAHRLENVMPSARARLIGNAGHAAHLENPDAFIEAVADFLG